ncbi:MAG: sugar phosphate nucleotidyltransferase, partial [Haloferacaceae archaeon]
MKAVVLAGGYATRLWPITRRRPKMLLPLGE